MFVGFLVYIIYNLFMFFFFFFGVMCVGGCYLFISVSMIVGFLDSMIYN
jgi:hypothetical protein